MKNKITALFVATAGFASAASYTEYSSTIDVHTTYLDFNVAKFNTNLGTLTGVQVSVVQSSLIGSVNVTNNALTNTTVNVFDTTFTARQKSTNTLGYSQSSSIFYEVATTADWNVTTIAPAQTITFTANNGQAYTIASQNIAEDFFANYSSVGGTGTVDFQSRSIPTITTTGGSYAVNSDEFATTTQFAVTYTYTIPEPSAALLGGLGMLCLLRRRR